MKTTSILAKEKSNQFKVKHQNKILNVLKKLNKALTYKEIAVHGSFSDPVAVARRMSELVRLGKVKALESRKCSIAKSLCTQYELI